MSGSVTPADHGDGAAIWDAALASWDGGPTASFLRAYSDEVNRRLLDDWLPAEGVDRILKTDLFDEAVGDGLIPFLRQRGRHAFGVDVSPAVTDAARARFPELDIRRADARRLPFVDEYFDVVFSNSTLDHFEHAASIAEALAELHRVLRPGGRLLITLDNGVNPLVMLRNALPRQVLERLGLVPYPIGVTCGPKSLRKMLDATGFDVEASRTVMHCPRLLARGAAAVARAGSARLFRFVLAFEQLGRAPTRHLTGQFIAASARRR